MRAGPWNWISQVAAVTRFGVQTIPERRGASLAAATGIAGVVVVLVGVLSIAQGFRRAMTISGSPDNAVVLRSAADNEMMSYFTGEEMRVIVDAPGIARDAQGVMASPELFVIINLPKRSTGTDANVPLRGVSPAGFHVRDHWRLLAGRRFEPGRNEIIVGEGAAREFAGLDLGARLGIGRFEWEVVGIFSDGGGVAGSEIWTDAAVLQPAYQRGNTYQAAYVKLAAPGSFREFKDALTSDPRVSVKVLQEQEYYEQKSAGMVGLINGLGILIASLMALGALFGALNTMYSAVAARTREIATLRALGFNGGPVLISVLTESILLAVVGGVIGATGCYLALNGFETATLNFQTFSQVTFAFYVTPPLLALGVVMAVVLGFLGGLFPAIRAVRRPIAGALREL